MLVQLILEKLLTWKQEPKRTPWEVGIRLENFKNYNRNNRSVIGFYKYWAYSETMNF